MTVKLNQVTEPAQKYLILHLLADSQHTSLPVISHESFSINLNLIVCSSDTKSLKHIINFIAIHNGAGYFALLALFIQLARYHRNIMSNQKKQL